MKWTITDQSSYLVEVSGWDRSEIFFVESSMMEWATEGSRKVNLRSALREGTIVFVRLCQPITSNNNLPVAFQVKAIGSTCDNQASITLVQLHSSGQQQDSSSRLISSCEEVLAG